MDDFIDKVRDFYNETGEYFSKTRQKSYGIEGDFNWPYVSRELSTLKKGDRVLDLGCGNGRLVSGLQSGIEYLGVDFSNTLVGEAKKQYKDRKFVVGDISKKETYRNIGKFDQIYCLATLHHIPTKKDQIKTLKYASEHLKKNGKLIITVWNLVQMRYLSEHLKSLRLKSQNIRWVGIPFQSKNLRYCFTFDKRYMANLLMKSGYEVDKMMYVDREGEKVDFLHGRDLMVVARRS